MTKQVAVYCQDGYMPAFPGSFTDDLRHIADLIDSDPREVAVIEFVYQDGMHVVGVKFWNSEAEFKQMFVPKLDTQP